MDTDVDVVTTVTVVKVSVVDIVVEVSSIVEMWTKVMETVSVAVTVLVIRAVGAVIVERVTPIHEQALAYAPGLLQAEA